MSIVRETVDQVRSHPARPASSRRVPRPSSVVMVSLAFGLGTLALFVWGEVSRFAGAGMFLATLTLACSTRYLARPITSADTLVVVGNSPIESILSSLLTGPSRERRQDAPLRIVRALSVAEAERLVRNVRCDQVVLTGLVESPQTHTLVDARGHTPEIVPGAEALEQLLKRVPLEFAGEDPWLARLGSIRPLSPGYAIGKRLLDITVALILGVLVLPLLPVVALAIRLDSPGSILFRQQRSGLGGRPFQIYKFRTMRQEQAPEQRSGEWTQIVWTQVGDPRVTRVGRFLRLSRIDELPQLWNVLRGDMSLVGPRPEWVKSTEQLERELPFYSKRYSVVPGLTGWAQVNYRYANSVRGQQIKLEYDLHYVKHASLRLDINILMRTVVTVLRFKGA